MSKFERHGKITQVTTGDKSWRGFCHMRDFKKLTNRGATVTLPSIQKKMYSILCPQKDDCAQCIDLLA